jgi:hypothetical protein
MKNKGLIIATVIFFVVVNTSYFWESKFGIYAFPFFFLLVLVYLVLTILFLRQLLFSLKEKFKYRHRLYSIALLGLVLSLTLFFPGGLIDFDRFEGKDLLVAEREGSANCRTTLKLKDDNKFIESIVCFGVEEISGNYTVSGDTILFTNIALGRSVEEYYRFAVIKTANYQNKKILGNLERYKNFGDTVGEPLWIIKNELTNTIN